MFSDIDKIRKISKKIFSLQDWLKNYGVIYYFHDPKSVVKRLKNNTFYDEWEIYTFGYRHYIYLLQDKISNKFGESGRVKISPATIEKIKQADVSKRGSIKKLSEDNGISSNYIYRIRKGERRILHEDTKDLSDREKAKLFLTKEEVEFFFSQMLTVLDFLNLYGEKYQIKTHQYVYKLCSLDALPDGWKSVRVGESWLIFRCDL